ncbi:MAG: sugar phosphate isomerase/epimerase family protein [Candidatus Brocadiia bacterium]
MNKVVTLAVGIKTDPIEYRFSFPWLFRLMVEEKVRCVQVGSFFEMYQLPDAFFLDLRRQAEGFGLSLRSVFTSHRELGGFLRPEKSFHDVAMANYRRLIEIGALLGAVSVGSNPGSVLRDLMGTKSDGVKRYLDAMPSLMEYARQVGLQCLTIEPMSCLAEPPTLPEEIKSMADALEAHHRAHSDKTVPVGFCFDVSHGYADSAGAVRCTPLALLETALPHVVELHLKNTDARFDRTFGFMPEECERGVVNVGEVRRFLLDRQSRLPVDLMVGYVEVPGPKIGRDYTDSGLETALRLSLRHVKANFEEAQAAPPSATVPASAPLRPGLEPGA